MVDLAPRSIAVPAAVALGAPWRFEAVRRMPDNRPQGDLSDARSLRLTWNLYAPATMTLAIDGRSGQLGWLEELRSDVIAYRWSDVAGAFVPMFRGCITASEDEISPTVHTVTFTATSYRGILGRRSMRQGLSAGATDQATIAGMLMAWGNIPLGYTGSLGLTYASLLPDGTPAPGNGLTGVLRDRTYFPGQVIETALDNLSTDINGFDWDVTASAAFAGVGTLWYPQRGTARPFVAQYGSTVTNVARVVSTTSFANYSMVTGMATDASPPPFAESFGAGWLDPVGNPEGAWMAVTAQSDVSQMSTLQQDADGNIALYGDLEPAYTLTLAPGRWSADDCWLGDTVRLIVKSGRLNVDTSVRITAIGVEVDDNGIETVSLTAGIQPPGLGPLLKAVDRRLDRLEIR